MPLRKGEAVGTAIKELYNHGSRPRSRDQILAIAETNHRRRAFVWACATLFLIPH